MIQKTEFEGLPWFLSQRCGELAGSHGSAASVGCDMAATGIAMGAGTSEQQELKTWASGRGGRLPRSATSTALGLSAAGRTGMGRMRGQRGTGESFGEGQNGWRWVGSSWDAKALGTDGERAGET